MREKEGGTFVLSGSRQQERGQGAGGGREKLQDGVWGHMAF